MNKIVHKAARFIIELCEDSNGTYNARAPPAYKSSVGFFARRLRDHRVRGIRLAQTLAQSHGHSRSVTPFTSTMRESVRDSESFRIIARLVDGTVDISRETRSSNFWNSRTLIRKTGLDHIAQGYVSDHRGPTHTLINSIVNLKKNTSRSWNSEKNKETFLDLN